MVCMMPFLLHHFEISLLRHLRTVQFIAHNPSCPGAMPSSATCGFGLETTPCHYSLEHFAVVAVMHVGGREK